MIPKGTRDFTPEKMVKRNFIFDTAKHIFKQFGFDQIETPATENLSALTGKYGDEGDQLMFKLLMRGDKFKQAVKNADENSKEDQFADLALRYDLTVPFARFVADHQNELTFPFKRFQIQPVWRADRPQKGRYREFYQCDVDIIGSNSLWCEIELIQIFNEVLTKLTIPNFTIKLNNRKILSGIAELVEAPDKIIDITIAIDKLDKIGLEKVIEELVQKGMSEKAITQLKPILNFKGSNQELLKTMSEVLKGSTIGKQGIQELQFILDKTNIIGADKYLSIDFTLARGLNYYTGAIFEVSCTGFKGSICGGGRYDGLTDLFGLKGISGVGISFGADRIFDVLEENQLFPKNELQKIDYLALNFGEAETTYVYPVIIALRAKGLICEIYPDTAKMKKQMSYANKKEVHFVILAGEDEMNTNKILIKNMLSGEQLSVSIKDFL